jgi:hypothetical protein
VELYLHVSLTLTYGGFFFANFFIRLPILLKVIKFWTHIYDAIVKSTITYAAETWCSKARTVAKLNSTEMDFWRHSARISKKDKIRNIVIKQKMTISNPNNFSGMGTSKEWKREDCQKKL